ncbi:MAG: MFS transporter [Solirubrobacteraceae bacterium]|nr:MFS transporter [Solirubrobacteraceae bacterium]
MSTPALWASCLAMTLVYNNNGLVNVALPTIGRRLGADVVALQWVVNAYALALSALMLTAGALSDRFGARRVVLAGTAVFAAGSAAAAAAPSIGALIAAQGATGLGAALLVPAALSMLTHA